MFLCAFAAEWLVFRLIQRPVALLEARLPQTARAPALGLQKSEGITHKERRINNNPHQKKGGVSHRENISN